MVLSMVLPLAHGKVCGRGILISTFPSSGIGIGRVIDTNPSEVKYQPQSPSHLLDDCNRVYSQFLEV